MYWQQISTSPALGYELIENGRPVLTLHINYRSSIFRAECQSSKRLFFIDREGFWKNKVVLKNEYGFPVGKLSYEKLFSNSGVIDIEGKQYHFSYNNNPEAELVFYKDNQFTPLVSCGLTSEKGNVGIQLKQGEHIADTDMKYFLFALSWYLFLPVAQEHTSTYAFQQT